MTDSDDQGPDVPLDPDVRALLADPRMWQPAPDGMADHVATVVRSEAPAAATSTATSTGTSIATSTGTSTATSTWAARLLPTWARPALLGAAAVVVLFFGGVAMFSTVDDASTRTRVAALLPTGLVQDVQGEAEFAESDAGVSIGLDAPSLPPLDGDRFYEGWVHTADGQAIPVGTFHSGDAVELWAAVDLDEVHEFTITREEAEEPQSVEHRGSGEVVLKATIGGSSEETDVDGTGTGGTDRRNRDRRNGDRRNRGDRARRLIGPGDRAR